MFGAAVSSRLAGPGTRANIDEFTRTTARAIEAVGGAAKGKASIILNPAEPPMIMRDTIFTLSEMVDEEKVRDSVLAMIARVQSYVPGYRLKQDVRTRHIPIHVVSAGDHTESAYSLGAIGFANKPVTREQLVEVLQKLETKLAQRMHRVLVVEDDVRNVFALSSILEPTGLRVEIARNAREALEALDRAGGDGRPAIDLVLMDIMMPEMDGYTAMREIRARPEWRRLPIIALTAKAMKDDQETCLAAGASDYIAKPLDVERLLSLVRVWMGK